MTKTCVAKQFLMAVSLIFIAVSVNAETVAAAYTESTVAVAYVQGSGFGDDENLAAIKLDTQDTLEAACLWDVILFDPASASGKLALQELEAAVGSGKMLSSIRFNKDPETADCLLVDYSF